MDLRSIVGAMLALAIAASPALACKGTEEIFSDDFADDSGMWGSADWIAVGGGALELKLPAGYQGVARYRGDTPKDFDLCVDLTYPEAKKPDGGTFAGISLWFKDYDNQYVIATTPIGAVGAFRVSKGKLTLQAPFRKYPQMKAGAGQTNTLRVTVKGPAVTVYANDQRVAGFRGVPDEGFLGLIAESESDNSNAWKFSNLKVTDAPK
jgi:hypothetical protein